VYNIVSATAPNFVDAFDLSFVISSFQAAALSPVALKENIAPNLFCFNLGLYYCWYYIKADPF
jgi:hypothetical protein